MLDLMMTLVVPLTLGLVAVYAACRRVDVYDALIQGAGEGLGTLARIIPSLVGLMTAVYMLRASGALDLAAQALGLYLIIGKVVNLADLLSGIDALPQYDIQQSQLTVNLGTDIQVFLTFADQQDILPHIRQAGLHLIHLDRAGDRVLAQALGNQGVLLRG